MKLLLSTIALLFITFPCFSQEMVTKDVGDFHELKVFDLIFVRFIQADVNKVIIKGEFSEDLKIINDDGVLKIRMQTDKRFQGEDTYVEVYAKRIRTIDVNEGTQVTVNEMIEQASIELRAQEGGTIIAPLKVDFVKVKAVTGGIIETNGFAAVQEVQINSGGEYDGQLLKTNETTVKVTAGGEADIFATQEANIKITAGGDVTVYGNPTRINKKKFAGGSINVVN